MTSMTVLYLQDTHHVLAAVTRTADATTAPAVADFAPAGLLARGVGTSSRADVTVEAARLAAVTVDVDMAVLAGPRAFAVTPGDKPTVDRIAAAPTAVGVVLTPDGAVVTADTVEEVKVLLAIEKVGVPAAAPAVFTGTMSGGSATFTVSLEKGDWQAAVFVAGRHPAAIQHTIT